MNKTLLAFGSNIEPRFTHISLSLSFLKARGLICKNLSSLYINKPIFKTQSPNNHNIRDFINLVGEFETNLQPMELLKIIKDTENKIGRINRGEWAAREIDIDILYYNQDFISLPELKIPHPEIQNRPFVLYPLEEIQTGIVTENCPFVTLNKSILKWF